METTSLFILIGLIWWWIYCVHVSEAKMKKRQKSLHDYEQKRAEFYRQEREKIKETFKRMLEESPRSMDDLLADLCFVLEANGDGSDEWKSDYNEMVSFTSRFRDRNNYQNHAGNNSYRNESLSFNGVEVNRLQYEFLVKCGIELPYGNDLRFLLTIMGLQNPLFTNFCNDGHQSEFYGSRQQKYHSTFAIRAEEKACYEMFDLTPETLTEENLKQAYRKLARRYHPDVSKTAEGEAKFKDICNARDFLEKKLARKC